MKIRTLSALATIIGGVLSFGTASADTIYTFQSGNSAVNTWDYTTGNLSGTQAILNVGGTTWTTAVGTPTASIYNGTIYTFQSGNASVDRWSLASGGYLGQQTVLNVNGATWLAPSGLAEIAGVDANYIYTFQTGNSAVNRWDLNTGNLAGTVTQLNVGGTVWTAASGTPSVEINNGTIYSFQSGNASVDRWSLASGAYLGQQTILNVNGSTWLSGSGTPSIAGVSVAPVPEPGSAILGGVAAVGAFLRRRRRA